MTVRDSILRIIAWNVYIGSAVKAVRAQLKNWIRQYKPEIIALMEASKMYGDLEGLGYEIVHLKPRPLRKGSQPAQGDVALMIRNDIPIKGRYTLRLKKFWKGPKHGWVQDPKVYRWVKIKWDGVIWKIGVAHSPFGDAARKESNNALVNWFRHTVLRRPIVLVLDANMLQAAMEKLIADKVDADVSGHHIDLIAYKNCTLIHEKNLGKGVSDHPAMQYDMRTKRRRRVA